jgi:hypothetical protein
MTVLSICPACGAGLRYRIWVPLILCILAAAGAITFTISTIESLAEWKVAGVLTAIVAVTTMVVVWSLGQFGQPRQVALRPGVTLASAIRMHRRLIMILLVMMAGGGVALTKLAMLRLAESLQLEPSAVRLFAFALIMGDTLIMLGGWMAVVELFDRMLERRRQKGIAESPSS